MPPRSLVADPYGYHSQSELDAIVAQAAHAFVDGAGAPPAADADHPIVYIWAPPQGWFVTERWRLLEHKWLAMRAVRRHFERTRAHARSRATSDCVEPQISVIDMPIQPNAPCLIAFA